MRTPGGQRATLTIAAVVLGLLNVCMPATGLAADPQMRPDDPARGVVLIASESLRDPRFARTVVLLTDVGPGGAEGVILNRPTRVTVVDAIPAFEAYIHDDAKIMFYGGPVESGVARVLVNADDPVPGGTRIVDGVYALNRLSVLKQWLEGDRFEGRTRFYGGYAGWGPGQVEAEIRRGDWILGRATAEAVFSPHVETLWDELQAGFSGLWVHDASPGSAIGVYTLWVQGAAYVKVVTNRAATNSGGSTTTYNLPPEQLRRPRSTHTRIPVLPPRKFATTKMVTTCSTSSSAKR